MTAHEWESGDQTIGNFSLRAPVHGAIKSQIWSTLKYNQWAP